MSSASLLSLSLKISFSNSSSIPTIDKILYYIEMYENRLTNILGSSELQHLLTLFNDLDGDKAGVISVEQAKNTFQSMNLPVWNDVAVVRALLRGQEITFDEFLALLYEVEAENGVEKKPRGNYRMLEFLQLLEDYREKCEAEGLYPEAQKAYKKVEDIKDQEMQRQQESFQQKRKSRLLCLNTLERDKIMEFNHAWEEYKKDYEASAQLMIEKLKSKHLLEMDREEQRVRRQFSIKPRQTKALRQMRDQQKMLANCKSYQQAQRMRAACGKLEEQERKERQQWMQQKLSQRTENIRKKQENILMAHLKKIETTRDLQGKKQRLDAQKLSFKLKRLKQEIEQKETLELKSEICRLRDNLAVHGAKRKATSLRRVDRHEELQESVDQKQPWKLKVNSFNKARMNSTSMYEI